jgi:hypothetical protein
MSSHPSPREFIACTPPSSITVTGNPSISSSTNGRCLTHSPALYWPAFLHALASLDVTVVGFAHFNWGQLVPSLPCERVYLAHTLGDIFHAVAKGTLPAGASVLFNGGCMLRPSRLPGPRAYGLRPGLLDGLRQLQGAVRLGFYVQETDLDQAAATVLVALANQHAELFPLGFAWGAASGAVLTEPAWSARSGVGWQLWLGRQW